MKLKKIAILLGAALMAIPSMAQYEGTRVYDRVGHGADSVKALQNLSLFQTAIKQKDFAGAYTPWKELLEKAPFSQLGIYANGAYMLASLFEQTQDVEQKQTYFKELMNLYDVRMKNLDGLNSFTKEAQRATPGDVLAYKAYYHTMYGPKGDPNYKLSDSYDLFSQSLKLINENGAKEVKGFILDMYFRVSNAMFLNNRKGFREQFLQDYLDSKEVCDKMLAKANEESDTAKARAIVAEYDAPLNTIEGLFAESKAAEPKHIIALFTPKVEANKNNLAYLKSALTLMSENNCDTAEVYYKAAQYAYAIEPSYESAIGCAQYSQKQGKNAEVATYYAKALELCENDTKKSIIALKIASAMSKSGNIKEAYTYLDKAVQFNPAQAGQSYFLRANFLTKEGKYGEAIANCNKAAEADITYSGKAERLKGNILEAQRRMAEHQRQVNEYNKAVADQKAEEDFWKAGN